ncbi:MAG: M17 family peptidase N-terminal domain-containing protein [Polyangiales bacterium]
MTTYEFVASSMDSLDRLQAEVIVLPFFSDERPLTGAAALIDWRMCGALSRKLLAGHLDGHFGEKGMIAAPPRLKAEGLLLVGLGPMNSFDRGVAKRACSVIAGALRESMVTTAAMVLPGRSLRLIPALDVMQLWLDASKNDETLEEVSVIERAEEHRTLGSLLVGLRRQSESPLGEHP